MTKRTLSRSLVKMFVCCVAAHSFFPRRTPAPQAVSSMCHRSGSTPTVFVRRGRLRLDLFTLAGQNRLRPPSRFLPTHAPCPPTAAIRSRGGRAIPRGAHQPSPHPRLNPPPAQHPRALVKDHRLARGDGGLGFVEDDAGAVVGGDGHHAGRSGVAVANLDGAA